MQTIEKQELIKEPLASKTLKLAESIYSTYVVNEKDPYMQISVEKLYKLLGLENEANPFKALMNIFVDLTEPIIVRNFEYKIKKYPQMILSFCTFKEIKEEGKHMIEIELNEMYLEAMKNYMLNPFLEVK